ncbi:MAG: 5-(carboxyamino)imidazole ribonucleotide mutase [Oscillospiraceae bacterium]|nr:5-(carboxyamino)imidazole ribonucleotide mutase [Oscillospiraceae bacterium]
MKKVAVIMGSDSDIPVVQKAVDILNQFSVPYEVHIYSAHRTPTETKKFSQNARSNNFGVIIAAAGMAAHLAGAIAADTTLPVIGVPIESNHLGGIDALLSTVQMPPGIPVATVAIDGAVNAALLSIQILSLNDENMAKKLEEFRKQNHKKILEKNYSIENRFNNKNSDHASK